MKKKSNKRKKSFYNNKNRNTHWTEEPKGRKIDFADKYDSAADTGNKYGESARRSHENALRKKKKRQIILKRSLIALLCLVLISVGYTGMDIYMTRHAVPMEKLNFDSGNDEIMNEVDLKLSAKMIDSISLDGSIMLKSVINTTLEDGYSSIVFDAKREDGTIGYASTLASIDTYGATSSIATNPKDSVKTLLDNDILPVARICCYKDNVVPAQSPNMALMIGDKFYTNDDSTYLNPNSYEAYCYIRDIIRELNTYGINVFILTGCDMPDDISDKYSASFDKLSERLTAELGDGIKFIEEVDATIKGKDAETGKVTNSAIKKEIGKLKKLSRNQVYYISTKIDDSRIISQLSNSNATSYIIGE